MVKGRRCDQAARDVEEHTFCPLAFDVMVGAAAATLEAEEESVPEGQPLDWIWLQTPVSQCGALCRECYQDASTFCGAMRGEVGTRVSCSHQAAL